MSLPAFWFLLIAVLWIGYFVLEGFDFGVGMLLPVLGRDDTERRVLINTIGPVWDGNEVWLLVAGGATFAAFPQWYATLFSGFYLPLLLILVALIIRGVAFEYRGKGDTQQWRSRWDLAIIVGSFVPALLWGVAFGNIIRGVAINADHQYTGGFFALLNPYSLLAGLTTLSLFLLHGAVFLALRTDGDIRVRARRLAAQLSIPVLAIAAVFVVITQIQYGRTRSLPVFVIAALALAAATYLVRTRHEALAFTATAVTIIAAVAALFLALFPDVMPSTTNPAFSLTVHNASSTHYTLTVMTWVAVMFTPVVLAYQGWTYWVFRARVTGRAQTEGVKLPKQAGPGGRKPGAPVLTPPET
jgi:cytochrome d ubiquinol oxidase subunit II